jgi:hypothetical protein
MTAARTNRARAARPAKKARAKASVEKSKPEKVYRSINEVRSTFYPPEDSRDAPWSRSRRLTRAVFGPDSERP